MEKSYTSLAGGFQILGEPAYWFSSTRFPSINNGGFIALLSVETLARRKVKHPFFAPEEWMSSLTTFDFTLHKQAT